MKRTKNKPTRRLAQLHKAEPKKSPFIEHIHELRKRLFYIAISIILFASLAFSVQKQILEILRHPAGEQIFTTTTPGGAFNFLFTICIAAGVIASIPVILYQILRYMQPLLKQGYMRVMTWGCIASGLLAISGVVFGYFFGLPNSLKFLFNQSANLNIQAMITIDSYASFVTMYLLGAALLFQVPLVLVLINRIKPLTPGQLFKYERPFVIASFIFGAIISPSPNVQDMLILAIPTIAMYQISMVIIWIINHKHRKPKKVVKLLKKDAELQAERLAKFQEAQSRWQNALQNARTSAPATSKNIMAQQPALATNSVSISAPAMQPAPRQLPVAPAPIKPAIKVISAPVAQRTPSIVAPSRRPARGTYVNDFKRRPGKRI